MLANVPIPGVMLPIIKARNVPGTSWMVLEKRKATIEIDKK